MNPLICGKLLTLVAVSLLTLSACNNPTPRSDPTHSDLAAANSKRASLSSGLHLVPDSVPGEETLPPYPGSVDIQINSESAPLSHSILFTTRDSFTKVYNFYRDEYLNQGWVLNDKRINFFDPDFIWVDTEGLVPYHLGIGVDYYNDVSNGSRYIVWLERSPDPNDVPIYPEAERLELGIGKTTGDMTYVTNAKPEELIDFYQANMEKYGWTTTERTVTNVTFSNHYGVPERYFFNTTRIEVEKRPDGKTQVKVHIHGSDLTNQWDGTPSPPPVAPTVHLPGPPPIIVEYPGTQPGPFGDEGRLDSSLDVSIEAYLTNDKLEVVRKFYLEQMQKVGWKHVSHPREDYLRFTYEGGSTCQRRHSVYVITSITPNNQTHIKILTKIGCYVITGDE